jgi:hypothetical protein
LEVVAAAFRWLFPARSWRLFSKRRHSLEQRSAALAEPANVFKCATVLRKGTGAMPPAANALACSECDVKLRFEIPFLGTRQRAIGSSIQ